MLYSIKEHYKIPESDSSSQADHAQKLRTDFRKAGLYPTDGDLLVKNVEEAHSFDERVSDALSSGKIDLYFSRQKSGKKFIDSFEERFSGSSGFTEGRDDK